MKKIFNRIISIALCVIIVLGFMPAMVRADEPLKYDKTRYVFYRKGMNDCTAYISITKEGSKDILKITDVKSSKKSVGYVKKIRSSNYDGATYKIDNSAEDFSSKDSNATIEVKILKPGKTTISYKVNGQKCKTTVIAEKFYNPVKKLTLTGFNKGKNIIKSFKCRNDWGNNMTAAFKQTDVKNSKLNISLKKGWKVTYVSVRNDSINYNHSMNRYYYDSKSFKRMKSIKKFNVGKLSAKRQYTINITVTDVRGRTINYELYFNNDRQL